MTGSSRFNIVVFGAAGRLGSRIVSEATARGHGVTSVVREGEAGSSGASVVIGDSTSARSVSTLASHADILVSAVGGPDKTIYLRTAQTLVETLGSMSDAPRIIQSGGGGSLLNEDGIRFVDAPDFPPQLREEVLGQAAALDFYRTTTGVTWTYMSPPPGNFAPGERLGHYRIGGEHPVTDDHGKFGISYEDYAMALVDEIETPAHLNARFTVGY